jgi:hypothetical protein
MSRSSLITHDTLRLHVSYYDHWFAVPVSGTGIIPSDADSRLSLYPKTLSLSSAPNPFNPSTRIVYAVPQTGHAALCIYNISGRLVRTLADGYIEAGEHVAVFDGHDLTSGVYFAALRTASRTMTQKLLLLK